MSLLRQRERREDQDWANRPSAREAAVDEAPGPQPEQHEPTLADPRPSDLSKRDYLAIVRRAFKEASNDHVTNLAAALAYYAFLAIPSALLVAVGVFSILAGPHAVDTL